MSLPYDEQIKVWASSRYDLDLATIESVSIDTRFNEGYACCGGADPNCYCSFAESASMYLTITVAFITGGTTNFEIDMIYGDMGKLIQEIIES